MGGVGTLKKTKLNITFHNPNTVEEVAKELIKISAEVAKAQISDTLLHSEEAEEQKKQEESA